MEAVELAEQLVLAQVEVEQDNIFLIHHTLFLQLEDLVLMVHTQLSLALAVHLFPPLVDITQLEIQELLQL